MGIEGLFSISQFGLSYERLRLEASIRNISQANATLAPGQAPLVARVTASGVDAGFAGMVGGAPQVHLTQAQAGSREVHDPSNPMADKNGNVRYADIDMVTEMTNLMSASRAYEANVRGINTLEQMAEKALQIGGR